MEVNYHSSLYHLKTGSCLNSVKRLWPFQEIWLNQRSGQRKSLFIVFENEI